MSGGAEERVIKLLKESLHKIGLEEEVSFVLEVPREKKYGDLATNLAFKVAGKLRKSPEESARMIVQNLPREKDLIEKIEIAGEGFINFFLSEKWLYKILEEIEKKKDRYGHSRRGRGKKVILEFVSANPTGPLHVGHGRAGVVGDVLANILEANGYEVEREYYYNDAGKQMATLGSSLRARYLQLLGEKVPLPDEGYQGEYVKDIARKLFEKDDSRDKDKDLKFFSSFAEQEILKGIKKDLKDLDIKYDSWVKETTLHQEGKVKEVVELLRKKKYLYEKEGALWLKSTSFGDDKDRVVIRSNGEPTYLAPDIAYHKNKYERGFKWLINILGPDHHGYVTRLRAGIEALGYPETSLSILILQLVTLYRGKKKIPMSTRSGDFVTLRQIVEEVGKDAARFFFLMRGRESHLDFDLELAREESPENPVYYIQYAHARICSILGEGEKREAGEGEEIDFALLKEREELDLVKKVSHFPQEVISCARNLEPQGMARYLQELAALFHQYYAKFRVISSQKALTAGRLFLVKAVGSVLKNGLTLLGVSAPQKM